MKELNTANRYPLDGLYRSRLDAIDNSVFDGLSRAMFDGLITLPYINPINGGPVHPWNDIVSPWSVKKPFTLATDYFIENNTITLNVDVAGSSAEDVHVDVDTENYIVDVKVKKQYEKKDAKPNFKIRERVLSEQSRQFHLPRDKSRQIDFKSFTATVKDGLLTIKADFTEPEEKPKEKLTIKVS